MQSRRSRGALNVVSAPTAWAIVAEIPWSSRQTANNASRPSGCFAAWSMVARRVSSGGVGLPAGAERFRIGWT